ncbi:UDP-glucose 4-epimerase family protein [Noviherbaspirillum pedocola]|uniref:SDR family oxidoreductase n=1 Tax=Noviherbaspirillum pedocola TaxID=2801341 RepID=A0A934SMU3_9BURK|nr:SDR family oxidoreductase [Noviherbaspirillum pedocola]MBK4733365.1 SDR family oxidoreductase [Noviherbaspirillum pedocola]
MERRWLELGKVLVTGANGFVGSALCAGLEARGMRYVAAVRRRIGAEQFEAGDIAGPVDWAPALAGCDTVIHLAARVHMMRDASSDPLAAYRAVNADATLALARQAAQQGVRRFVFLSSVKVNGERSPAGRPFSAQDRPAPQDPYGMSKLEAEQRLSEWAPRAGLELVIVRPPLVYGPGVRANFLRLLELVRSGVPLPLGAVRNQRSMVGIDNLVDFLLLCAEHPDAAHATWMVSDNHDVSIAELIGAIAAAMGKPARLLRVPPALLSAAAALVGKRPAAGRLLDTLQVDVTPALQRLGWRPPVAFQDGIAKTVAHFLQAGEAR